jgi:hypothetical protein
LPEDGGCDCDGADEGAGATVVSDRDPSPVLGPAEHALDASALLVSLLIAFDPFVSAGAAARASRNQSLSQPLSAMSNIVAAPRWLAREWNPQGDE